MLAMAMAMSEPDPIQLDPTQPIHVLLVEDNPGDRRLVREYLNEPETLLTFEFREADSLAMGKALLAEARVDIVLLDLNLPDSTGVETFETIHTAAPDVPVIILSGMDDEDLAVEIVKHGAQDYLPKDPEILTGKLLRRAIRYAIERKLTSVKIRMMERQLIQAEKLESIGTLASGVAHEVKNPLARLRLAVDYLKGGISADDPNIPVLLERMTNAINRADAIVTGMVNFASDRDFAITSLSITGPLEQALLMVDHELLANTVTIKRDLPEDLPDVEIDSDKVEQVIINLLMNAVHAMESVAHPVLTIRASVETVSRIQPEDALRELKEIRKGDRVVVVKFLDNGIGIPPEKLDKIFEPFFTTKPTGKGTGLGLSVSKKIISLLSGSLEVHNLPEGGACATLMFKVAPTNTVKL